MTLKVWTLRTNFFVKHDLSELLPLPPHDQVMFGDFVTVIRLNANWRVFMVGILDTLMDSAIRSAPESEVDLLRELYLDMFEDLYD